MVTVGIIEDDTKLRQLYIDTLQKFDAVVEFACSSVEEFKNIRQQKEAPFVFLLDIGLPGLSGLEAINIINEAYPDTHLVIISGNADEKVIWNAITRGAKGYLVKPIKLDSLRQQLEIVIDGGALISPEVGNILVRKIQAEKLALSKSYAELTQREREVLNYLLKGLTYKEVAVKMELAVSTINDFIKKIYRKMDVHSKTELVALFV